MTHKHSFVLWVLCVLKLSTSSSYDVLLVNPECELWLWSSPGEISVDSPYSLTGVSAPFAREIFSTKIRRDAVSDLWLIDHSEKTLHVDSSNSTSEGRISSISSLWGQSEYSLYIDTAAVRNRPKLQLLQDFEFYRYGQMEKNWLQIREGEDVYNATDAFLLRSIPSDTAADKEQVSRLRQHVLDTVELLMNNREDVLDLIKESIREVVELQDTLNIVVGEVVEKISTIDDQFWIHFSVNTLDLTDATSFALDTRYVFDKIMAEHVWEHLTLAEAIEAARNCYVALAPGGLLRIAVPDYNWHISEARGGSGDVLSPKEKMDILGNLGKLQTDIRDSHLIHWSVCSLSEVLMAAGFASDDITPVEYTDATGVTMVANWSAVDGPIYRSSKGSSGKSVSIVIDAKKPSAALPTEIDVSVGIDCTDLSLSLSVKELWPHLVTLLNLKLRRIVSSPYKIVVFISPTASDHADMLTGIKEEIRNLTAKNVYFQKVETDGKINDWCSSPPYAMIDILKDMRLTHFITSVGMYETCPSWREVISMHSTQLLTLHTVVYDNDIKTSTASCQVPYVSSLPSSREVATCMNTRLGLIASSFGERISDSSLLDVRETIASMMEASGKSVKVSDTIRNNPYIVIALSKSHCDALSWHAVDSKMRAESNKLSEVVQEAVRYFWSVVDGVIEGSSNLALRLRPWLILIGDCDWKLIDPSGRLESIEWIGILEKGLENYFRRQIVAGALVFVSLPSLRGGLLSYSQYPVLQALALGCPVIVGPPADFTNFESLSQPTVSDSDNLSYIKTYFNGTVTYLSRMEPFSVWSAVRPIIMSSREGSKYLIETKSRRLDIVNKTRRFFLGWNKFATTVVKEMEMHI